MTGIKQPHVGDPNAPGRQHDHVADLRDVVVRLPERDDASSPAPAIHLGNVVPFTRLRLDTAPARQAPEVSSQPAERPAPLLTDRQRSLFLAFLAVSLACHGSFYFLFNREPTPMESIGIEAISVEIVVGDNVAPAQTPGQSAPDNTPADDPDPVQTDTETATAKPETVQEAKPVEDARTVTTKPETVQEAKPVEDARTVTAETTPREARPEQPAVVTATETPEVRTEQANQQMAALPVLETPMPREPELTVAPEVAEEPKPADPVKPQPVKSETKPEPQPKPKVAEPRETKRKTERGPERKQERPGPVSRTASNTQEGTGPRSRTAGGLGIGRSQADTNYPGIVRAHLARYQRTGHTEQGSATVTFGLDGSGRVTSVSARGSGHASLDQEAQAMVRRASPFPAPPPGASRSFTISVRFAVR